MYFSEYKFAVKINEEGYTDRNQNEENKRQIKIEKHSDCKFFHRLNPDAESFDIFLEISKIKYYITQSNRKTTKGQKNKIKEQKRKFAKELLSYVSSSSMPVKRIKYFAKKYFPHCKA